MVIPPSSPARMCRFSGQQRMLALLITTSFVVLMAQIPQDQPSVTRDRGSCYAVVEAWNYTATFRAAPMDRGPLVLQQSVACPDFGQPGGVGRGSLPPGHPFADALISPTHGVTSADGNDAVQEGQVSVLGLEVMLHNRYPGHNASYLEISYTEQPVSGVYRYNMSVVFQCAYVDPSEPATLAGQEARVISYKTRSQTIGGRYNPPIFIFCLEGIKPGDRIYVKWWVLIGRSILPDGTEVGNHTLTSPSPPAVLNPNFNVSLPRTSESSARMSSVTEHILSLGLMILIVFLI